jgi:hypothetical protein
VSGEAKSEFTPAARQSDKEHVTANPLPSHASGEFSQTGGHLENTKASRSVIVYTLKAATDKGFAKNCLVLLHRFLACPCERAALD